MLNPFARVDIRHGAYLPHWTQENATYVVVFRLCDSLPSEVLRQWIMEREDIVKTASQAGRDLSESERQRLAVLYAEKVEKWLDSGYGACWLKDERIASIVRDALAHFDGTRYTLLAWCVMPNHVHAVLRPAAGHNLADILHSWKSFTAKKANEILNRSGEFWQAEYYDHLIRDEKDFRKQVEYVLKNPAQAGLADWKWLGVACGISVQCGTGGRGTGVPPVGQHGQDAHATGTARGTGVPPVNQHGQDAHATGTARGTGVPPVNQHGQDAHATAAACDTGERGTDRCGTGVPPVSQHGQDAHATSTAPHGQDARATNVREPEWPAVDFIIGNPPFLGGNRIRQELGSDYVEQLFALYEGRVPAFADLCCYWFEKARAHIAAGKCRRAGLLATQGIRGGANREVLKRIKESGDIFWAESDRPWILDGANVHVSMVGFDDGEEQSRILDGNPVATINANLTSCADITTAAILAENRGICFMGPSPKAPFDIDAETAAVMLADKGNPNGRPNSDVVRPVVSAVDIAQGSRGMWSIDFGVMPIGEAAQYEKPFEYVKANVLPVRETRRDDYRGMWWQYARPRPEMRTALRDKRRYIATPGVSKHRLFVWVSPEVPCNQGTLVFARDDDAFFGILHSRFHEVWARAQGTQLREAASGCRYTPTTSFETFPRPVETEAIAEAARDLVVKRDRWLNPEGASAAELRQRTLTKLYNARPTWLADCHARLDAAVAAAYGWPADLSDDAILERLLALNLERAGG